MFFRQIYDEKLAEAAYLIGCQKTGEAIVIDPERDIDRYESVAKANGLRIVAVADTHIHADYLTGAREFAEKGARVYLSDEGDADWKYQWVDKKSGGGRYDAVLLKDGDTFLVGNIRLRAVHTPGHTPEHLSYEVTDIGGGADAPMGIATGDFLFVGDLGGRTFSKARRVSRALPTLPRIASIRPCSERASGPTTCRCGRVTARAAPAARRLGQSRNRPSATSGASIRLCVQRPASSRLSTSSSTDSPSRRCTSRA
ncbi:MAG: MBL fold metallo-hydrolase [bacterium]